MKKPLTVLPALAAAMLLLAACSAPPGDADATGDPSRAESTPEIIVGLEKGDGASVGTATFEQSESGTAVSLELEGMEPGFHGFHIHMTGECEPDSAAPDDPEEKGDFLSAGGHLGSDVDEHPNHAGDLPSVLINDDGTGELTFTTDRFTMEDLTDDDGSAVMIHSGTDNFANVPERYADDGADEDTLGTGDAGTRVACGVVE